MNKSILSFKEFIAFADISSSKGYKAIHNKELPYFKQGEARSCKVYLKKEDIIKWMTPIRISSSLEIAEESLL